MAVGVDSSYVKVLDNGKFCFCFGSIFFEDYGWEVSDGDYDISN